MPETVITYHSGFMDGGAPMEMVCSVCGRKASGEISYNETVYPDSGPAYDGEEFCEDCFRKERPEMYASFLKRWREIDALDKERWK